MSERVSEKGARLLAAVFHACYERPINPPSLAACREASSVLVALLAERAALEARLAEARREFAREALEEVGRMRDAMSGLCAQSLPTTSRRDGTLWAFDEVISWLRAVAEEKGEAVSLSPKEIAEIEAVAKTLECYSWSPAPDMARRLRALLPEPEKLEDVCKALVSWWEDEGQVIAGTPFPDRLRAALDRRRREQGK